MRSCKNKGMDVYMHPYPHDYLISREPDGRLERHYPLGNLVLSAGPSLRVRDMGDGRLMLGVAFPSGEDAGNLDTLSGRWLLIDEATVTPDASALIGCFYSRERQAASSNPKLITDREPDDTVALAQGFVIPPASGYDDLRRLLPSQVLDLNRMAPIPRGITWRTESSGYEEALRSLAGKYQAVLRSLAAEFSDVYLALTGGVDSRLLLATTHAVGIRAKAYTNMKPWPYMLYADQALPPRLAELAGLPHQMNRSKGLDRARLREYRKHLGPVLVLPGSTAYYAASGHFDSYPKTSVILNGLCGELGRNYYGYKFSDDDIDANDVASIAPATIRNREAARDLLAWWDTAPMYIPRRERLYWEARLAGWASESFRQSDLVYQGRIAFFMPVMNCLDTFADCIALPEDKREGGGYLRDLIALMLPAASDLPINPIGSRAEHFTKRAFRGFLNPIYRKFI